MHALSATTRRPWRARAATSAVFALALATAACGSDSKGGPTGTDSVTGRYNISAVTVDGNRDSQAPYFVLEGQLDDGSTAQVFIDGGYLELQSGGHYATHMTMSYAVGGAPTALPDVDGTGTYSVSGNTITLTDADGTTSTATRDGNKISATQGLDLDDDGADDLQMTLEASK